MSDERTSILDLDHLHVRYPSGTDAVADVSLSLAAAEFVSVVGPSGCGKSTLLRVAAGLLNPTGGSVTNRAGRMSFVFQDPTLLPWRSVRRNVELTGELSKLDRPQRRTLALQALARVGLGDVADQRPATLSVGMRMRVSLARALINKPDLFLFDEPFAAVDELTRARLGDDLQALFLADRFAALFITHSVAEAVYLSHRVVVMSARPGRVLGQVDVPAEYPRTPALRFSAEFAGWCQAVADLLGSAAAEPTAMESAVSARTEVAR
ncbi:MAG TPA: ABC transporter ATP-binding protein [Micromonosporaceae bacterium]